MTKRLDIKKLQERGTVIYSFKESLKDITPFDWDGIIMPDKDKTIKIIDVDSVKVELDGDYITEKEKAND